MPEGQQFAVQTEGGEAALGAPAGVVPRHTGANAPARVVLGRLQSLSIVAVLIVLVIVSQIAYPDSSTGRTSRSSSVRTPRSGSSRWG